MRAIARAAALVLGLTAAPMLGQSAAAAMQRPFPLVTVAGEGTVSVRPNMADVTAGVTSEAKTPREAAEANAKAMAGLIAAAKEAGIADADIRTARFSISPVHAQRERGEPRVSGYRVSNQVTATVRDLAKLGDILDRLVAAGATDVRGVEFRVSDVAKLLDEARKAAFEDAKRKAELFAKAAGAQVGRAVNISEEEAQPPVRPYRMLAPAAGQAAPATPMEPGEETLRVHISVSFELNQ
jgi:uncharacterized protein YggE